MEFVNKATGLNLYIPKMKVKLNVCSIWQFAQISDDFFSWYLALCQIFCCSIIQAVSFNYHQRNVRSGVSVSVLVSAFMTKSWSRSRLEI